MNVDHTSVSVVSVLLKIYARANELQYTSRFLAVDLHCRIEVCNVPNTINVYERNERFARLKFIRTGDRIVKDTRTSYECEQKI
jgi:hypothetical protein